MKSHSGQAWYVKISNIYIPFPFPFSFKMAKCLTSTLRRCWLQFPNHFPNSRTRENLDFLILNETEKIKLPQLKIQSEK
jgi:hypothetical protein